MNKILKIIVGETAETIMRVAFDHRIAQESGDIAFNTISKAGRIKDLKNQIMGFVKRNPNSVFDVTIPEYKSDKKVKIAFTNFNEIELDENNITLYSIVIKDNFVNAEITQKVKIGKDITLKIKAE